MNPSSRCAGLHWTDDGVRVRWAHGVNAGCTWECAVHGRMTTASCSHALEAAVKFAADLLGVRATFIHPEPETSR